MKSQRRRELKANSLIWTLQGLPQTIKKYQSQVALGVVLVALAIMLIQYRYRTAQQRLEDATNSLGNAADDLQTLQREFLDLDHDPRLFMKVREETYLEGLQQADVVLQKAPDSQVQMRAQALLDKGDLNFEMANFPDLPGAATQPSLSPAESRQTLLANASDAYLQALHSYDSQKPVAAAAHFGLAAVAEDRAADGDPSQWDAAKAQYQAVIDGDADQPIKALAKQRLDLLAQLRVPTTLDLPATTRPAASRPGDGR